MGSITKALGTGLTLKSNHHQDDSKIRIRYCRGDDGLDGRKRRELDEEAKHVARKVKDVTKRMDDEDMVKEKIRCKQQEDQTIKRIKKDTKKVSEMTRAEKNRQWRIRKEKELNICKTDWRTVEDRVREELNCPYCRVEMSPPCKIYQCRDGHVVCEECRFQRDIKVCSSCQYPITGRNIAMESISRIFFHELPSESASTTETDSKSSLTRSLIIESTSSEQN